MYTLHMPKKFTSFLFLSQFTCIGFYVTIFQFLSQFFRIVFDVSQFLSLQFANICSNHYHLAQKSMESSQYFINFHPLHRYPSHQIQSIKVFKLKSLHCQWLPMSFEEFRHYFVYFLQYFPHLQPSHHHPSHRQFSKSFRAKVVNSIQSIIHHLDYWCLIYF